MESCKDFIDQTKKTRQAPVPSPSINESGTGVN